MFFFAIEIIRESFSYRYSRPPQAPTDRRIVARTHRPSLASPPGTTEQEDRSKNRQLVTRVPPQAQPSRRIVARTHSLSLASPPGTTEQEDRSKNAQPASSTDTPGLVDGVSRDAYPMFPPPGPPISEDAGSGPQQHQSLAAGSLDPSSNPLATQSSSNPVDFLANLSEHTDALASAMASALQTTFSVGPSPDEGGSVVVVPTTPGESSALVQEPAGVGQRLPSGGEATAAGGGLGPKLSGAEQMDEWNPSSAGAAIFQPTAISEPCIVDRPSPKKNTEGLNFRLAGPGRKKEELFRALAPSGVVPKHSPPGRSPPGRSPVALTALPPVPEAALEGAEKLHDASTQRSLLQKTAEVVFGAERTVARIREGLEQREALPEHGGVAGPVVGAAQRQSTRRRRRRDFHLSGTAPLEETSTEQVRASSYAYVAQREVAAGTGPSEAAEVETPMNPLATQFSTGDHGDE